MVEKKFGVAVDEKIVQEIDELVAECDDLGVPSSKIVEAILTAFVQSTLIPIHRNITVSRTSQSVSSASVQGS